MNLDPKSILAIDVGLTGALCHLSHSGASGSVISLLPMPTRLRPSKTSQNQKKRAKKVGKREIDVLAVRDWVREQHVSPETCLVIIEEPAGSQSASAGISLAGSFHALRALFELAGYSPIRIHAATWQRSLLRCAAGDTKPAALRLAKQLWPEESFLATPRCRVPSDGAIDASLIGHWAIQQKLNITP